MFDHNKLEDSLRCLHFHRGDREYFRWRLADVAETAAKAGQEGRKRYAAHALKLIADDRNLYWALEHLHRYGGGAPGPDGMTLQDVVDESSRWAMCRALRDDIKNQRYVPGDIRKKTIPKCSGKGTRTITIQNLEDRVVYRGAKQVLEPILDPMFLANSFGYRPGQDRSHALVQAIELTQSEKRFVWVQGDIADAFDNVPLGTVFDLFKQHLPSQALEELIRRCLYVGQGTKGLLQGSSLSPLCLNLYLHHKLDGPWQKRCPKIPLIRYADDILLLANRGVRPERRGRAWSIC